jgi:hypothetical protein
MKNLWKMVLFVTGMSLVLSAGAQSNLVYAAEYN